MDVIGNGVIKVYFEILNGSILDIAFNVAELISRQRTFSSFLQLGRNFFNVGIGRSSLSKSH
jgi:hypothetical protein